MKKLGIVVMLAICLVSCKDEVIKKPENLIEKETMVDIMYDLSVLDGIKYQNPSSLDSFKINPNKYIFKKYKIDSVQFAKSNIYYASNYEEYSAIFEEINVRLTKKRAEVTELIKAEAKKKSRKSNAKAVAPISRVRDSLTAR